MTPDRGAGDAARSPGERAGPVPIGPKSRGWLAAVGVTTEAQLLSRGALETYLDVLDAGVTTPNLNLLWGLEAVVEGVHWSQLPAERKAELRAAVAARTGSPRR